MNDPDDIARIEERIESLHEAIGRCRKLSLAAKLMIAAGVGWIALTLLALVPYAPALAFAALAAAIGGIVLLGSNSTTWTQTEQALAASEAMRAEWIAGRHMHEVEDVRTLH
jgi:flagellar biosynthesis component FlhA